MTSEQTQKSVKQIVIYLAVGGASALFELLVFELLYEVFGIDIVFSNIVAVLLATLMNFFLNGTITFKGSSNMFRSAVLYVLLFAFNLVFTSSAISLLVSLRMHSAIAKVVTQACVVVWNYVLYRKVIFK